MNKILLFAILGACAAPVWATDPAHCDSKPFTLNKPAPAAQKPSVQPKLADATPAKPAKKATPPAKPQPKPRLLANCKHPEKAGG